MRLMLEVVMLFALVGGLFYVMKVMAKESREDKALLEKEKTDEEDSRQTSKSDSDE
jgi:hypothetical protein